MSRRVLVTAFEPYDRWSDNSSWLALVEFTKSITTNGAVTTRLYPVDFDELRRRLETDLAADFDVAIHLGQAPGATSLCLEAVGLNVGGDPGQPAESYRPLVGDGPVAYQSSLPLQDWVQELRLAGIPASLSFHAGTFLCNATLYLTHYLAETMKLKTQATFIHLPLATSQAVAERTEVASLASEAAGRGIRLIVDGLIRQATSRHQELA